jgi:hypothetical protein
MLQEAVQRLTHIQSALTTFQSCIILLLLMQLTSIAYPIPHFRLFAGATAGCLLPSHLPQNCPFCAARLVLGLVCNVKSLRNI